MTTVSLEDRDEAGIDFSQEPMVYEDLTKHVDEVRGHVDDVSRAGSVSETLLEIEENLRNDRDNETNTLISRNPEPLLEITRISVESLLNSIGQNKPMVFLAVEDYSNKQEVGKKVEIALEKLSDTWKKIYAAIINAIRTIVAKVKEFFKSLKNGNVFLKMRIKHMRKILDKTKQKEGVTPTEIKIKNRRIASFVRSPNDPAAGFSRIGFKRDLAKDSSQSNRLAELFRDTSTTAVDISEEFLKFFKTDKTVYDQMKNPNIIKIIEQFKPHNNSWKVDPNVEIRGNIVSYPLYFMGKTMVVTMPSGEKSTDAKDAIRGLEDLKTISVHVSDTDKSSAKFSDEVPALGSLEEMSEILSIIEKRVSDTDKNIGKNEKIVDQLSSISTALQSASRDIFKDTSDTNVTRKLVEAFRGAICRIGSLSAAGMLEIRKYDFDVSKMALQYVAASLSVTQGQYTAA